MKSGNLEGIKNKAMAGERPVDCNGVFLYCRMALANLSSSREPVAVVLPLSKRFMDLTAASARWFE